jgi:hypothetical protein
MSRDRPLWDTSGATPFACYAWYFTHYYPALALAFLFGAVLLVRENPRPAVFVLSSFLPLMLAHVVFFTGRVAERYLTYLLPYFFIVACCPFERMLGALGQRACALWRARSRARALVTAFAVVPLAGLFAYTWLRDSYGILRWGPQGPNWKTVAPTLRELGDDCLVMSPLPLQVCYDSGEFPDYILRKRQPEDGQASAGRFGSRTVPLRWLEDAAEFERIVAEHRDVCVILTKWVFENDAYLDADMRAAIQRLLVQRDHPGDAGLLLYRKPF